MHVCSLLAERRNAAFCLLSDTTVHPPASKTHPYENQDPASMPPDMGFGCKMVNGVMHVYTTRNVMEKWDVYDGSLGVCMLCSLVGSVFRLHTVCWQQPDSSAYVFMLTGAQSWICLIQTCRSTSPIWTSWWPSLSTGQCELNMMSSKKFWVFRASQKIKTNNCFTSPQKVLLLPSSAVPQLQVSDAHPVEWDERAGSTEESPTSRLLQYP